MLKNYAKSHGFTYNFYSKVLFFTLSLLASPLLARETVTISPDIFAGGIEISLPTSDIAAAQNYLSLGDSSGTELALTAAALDGKSILLMNSSEPVKHRGVIRWHYDKAAGQLLIDIRGIRDSFAGASNFVLSIVPLNTRARQFTIAISQTDSPTASRQTNGQALKEISVLVKE